MSEILEAWRAGRGLPGVLVIDGHTHVGAWPHAANFDSIADAAAGAVAAMDANGVDAACVLSGGYMDPGADYRRGNDALLELLRRLPERLIGFAHVNPNDTLEGVRRELARVHEAGLRCIKLLNAYQQAYPGDGPNLMEVYRFAAKRNMLVINHYWPPEVLWKIARLFPSVDFIMAHYGGGADELLKGCHNVYANIWNLGHIGFIEDGVRKAGPGKFLYGSDAFMNPMSVGIGLVAYADIPDEHKRLILGENMARLLDKVGALPRPLRGASRAH